MNNKLTAEKIISITVLAEDENGTRFTSTLDGEEAERWMSEVRLATFASKGGKPFPYFNWKEEFEDAPAPMPESEPE